jgi:sulfur relay (sulfurtransferase) complex TusBCD TusD component (DsrE family)
MKPRNRVGLAVIAAIIVAVGVIVLSGPNPSRVEAKGKQKVVIHLSHYTDSGNAAFMAMDFAQYLQEHGADVTLLLDVDGVRLADQRQAQNPGAGMNAQISTHYDGFVKAGGKVLVCPHCAEVAGLTAQNLRPGARLGKDMGELADVILAADKILDY